MPELVDTPRPRLAGTCRTPVLDFSAFRAAVQQTFLPLRVTPNKDPHFEAVIGHGSSDEVSIASITAGAHLVERTEEHLASDPRSCYKLSLLVSGTGMLVQDGREVLLQPGDLAIYDTSRPYALLFDESFYSVVMMFPQQSIELPVGLVRQLLAVRIGAAGGVGGLVAANLEWLGGHLETLTGAAGARLARTAVDLVTTMLASELDVGREPHPHGLLLRRIRDYIDANLASPDLGPAMLASAHFISTRHLHALFQSEGTTVSSWIRERRLERCRRALTDPLYAERSIAAIAASFGFTDAAHFSRVFKGAFGDSPSEVRCSAG